MPGLQACAGILRALGRGILNRGADVRFENADGMKMPVSTRLEKGTYHWCRCGKTGNPPFCDGAHVGAGVEPLEFEVDVSSTKVLCSCGLTQNPPHCDGAHRDY